MIKYREFLRFCMVGVCNTLLNYGVFFLLFKIVGMYYLLSGALGFLAGAVLGFFLNRAFTFETQVADYQLLIYVLINVLSLAVNVCIQGIVVNYFYFPEILSQCAGIVVTTFLNYFLLKKIIFK